MLLKKIFYSIALHSIKHDNNKKRNIIIHHGLMGCAKNFRSISKNLAFSKYANVHLIDARNHGNFFIDEGQSPHVGTHTIEDLADDLYEYIQHNELDNVQQPLTLMGHSMGAIALMEFTKKYSSQAIQSYIDRVILIDISSKPIMRKASFKQTGQMLRDMNRINLNQPIQRIHVQIDKFALTPQIGGLIKSSIVQVHDNQHKWKVNLPVLVDYYPRIGNYSLLDDEMTSLKWKKPVDLIYGGKSGYVEQDQIYDYEKGYSQMTHDNFYRVDNAGHWVHFDQTKQFLKIVDYLLKKDQPKQQAA